MERKFEYTIAHKSTGILFPVVLKTKEEAEEYRQSRPYPDLWEIVKRKVPYGEWHKEISHKRIWFRVGMECEVTDWEYEILMNEKPKELMESIIERAKLSGETYIPEKYSCIDYDNPEEDVEFLF